MTIRCLYLLSFFLILQSCALNSTNGFDKRLKNYHYPFEVKEFNFSSQDKKLIMSYGDLGGENRSKIALLLHGKNFSGYYFDQIATELVKKGYRVIIPDQIGFGKSSKPDYYQYSFAQLAQNTLSLLNHLKIQKFTIVGHSMGGMLAVHLASMFDQRVEQIVLINPIGLENYLKYVEFKDPDFFYKNELNKTVDKFREYQKKNYYDGKWNQKYEKLLEPFKGWKAGKDYKLIAWNNALTYGPIFTEDIVTKFKDLTVRTTLILGTRDRTGPGRGWKKNGVKRELGQYQKLGKEVIKLNPSKINLIELDGLGHMPQFEDYDRFAKAFYPLF